MAGINAGVAAEPDETKRQMAQGALAASMQAYRLKRDGQPVPEELAAVVRNGIKVRGELIRAAGIQPE